MKRRNLERDQKIIAKYKAGGISMRAIGAEFGISGEAVRVVIRGDERREREKREAKPFHGLGTRARNAMLSNFHFKTEAEARAVLTSPIVGRGKGIGKAIRDEITRWLYEPPDP